MLAREHLCIRNRAGRAHTRFQQAAQSHVQMKTYTILLLGFPHIFLGVSLELWVTKTTEKESMDSKTSVKFRENYG